MVAIDRLADEVKASLVRLLRGIAAMEIQASESPERSGHPAVGARPQAAVLAGDQSAASTSSFWA